MANALEAASLVMIPSGYENGTLGSLKPLDGTGDFTFSRGSDISATRVNEDGYIEKGYENLLLQSNSFLTTWTTTIGMTLTPNQQGYDGSNNAWLVEKNANSYRRLTQNISISGVFALSVYAKAGTLDTIYLRNSATSRTEFDLANGVVGGVDQSIYSIIEPVGNEWYRCTAVFNSSISNIEIYIDWGEVVAGGVYLQDAMLNQGLVAYPYLETTTAPVAGGILEDMPRLDYSGSCPALLLEPQRTNLAPHSEYLDALTQDGNGDITSNSILSPEGLLNASKIEGQGGSAFIRARQVVSLPAAGSYCFSIFAKAGTSSNFTIIAANYTATGNTAADFVLTGSGSTTSNDATIEPVGNGWYRCCVYPIMDGVDLNGNFYVYVADDTGGIFFPSNADTLGQNLYLYGMQVEQDATYPTSYIPTYGTSQTRLQELGRGGDYIGSTITFGPTDDFSIFYDGEIFKNQVMIIGGGLSFLNGGRLWIRDTQIRIDGTTPSVSLMADTNVVVDLNTRFKLLVKRNGATIDFFLDGSKLTTTQGDTDATFVINSLFWSFNNAYICYGRHNQLTIFPTALSDDECKALTYVPPVEP